MGAPTAAPQRGVAGPCILAAASPTAVCPRGQTVFRGGLLGSVLDARSARGTAPRGRGRRMRRHRQCSLI
eukprot:136907-Pyramimonas_sp.AAC.1